MRAVTQNLQRKVLQEIVPQQMAQQKMPQEIVPQQMAQQKMPQEIVPQRIVLHRIREVRIKNSKGGTNARTH